MAPPGLPLVLGLETSQGEVEPADYSGIFFRPNLEQSEEDADDCQDAGR